jgi:ATP-dependent Clp protease ATP-binding subunit ClpA
MAPVFIYWGRLLDHNVTNRSDYSLMAKRRPQEFSTPYVYQMLTHQRQAAIEHHYGNIHPGHLVLGMLRAKGSIASHILHQIGITEPSTRDALSEFVKTEHVVESIHPMSASLEIHPLTNQLMERTYHRAVEEKKWIVGTDDFLFTLVNFEDARIQTFLAKLGLNVERVHEEFEKMRSDSNLLSKNPEAISSGLAEPTWYYRLTRQLRSLFKLFWP